MRAAVVHSRRRRGGGWGGNARASPHAGTPSTAQPSQERPAPSHSLGHKLCCNKFDLPAHTRDQQAVVAHPANGARHVGTCTTTQGAAIEGERLLVNTTALRTVDPSARQQAWSGSRRHLCSVLHQCALQLPPTVRIAVGGSEDSALVVYKVVSVGVVNQVCRENRQHGFASAPGRRPQQRGMCAVAQGTCTRASADCTHAHMQKGGTCRRHIAGGTCWAAEPAPHRCRRCPHHLESLPRRG